MQFAPLARTAIAAAVTTLAIPSSFAAFDSYVIRNDGGGNPPVIQTNNAYVPGATEFVISSGGQKAGLGSSDIDGSTLGNLQDLSIVRHDDPGRFTAGSGPAVAPYINFWITDGNGNFAVAANEPSDAVFQSLYNGGYQLDFADLADKPAKIYENNDKSWLPNNGLNLTFAQLAGFTIQAPTVAQLTTGWAGLGTGAPRQLGTNVAYGTNWVFGDTLSNYVSGAEGYVVSGAHVSAVPEPGAIALAVAGLGIVGAARRRSGRSTSLLRTAAA